MKYNLEIILSPVPSIVISSGKSLTYDEEDLIEKLLVAFKYAFNLVVEIKIINKVYRVSKGNSHTFSIYTTHPINPPFSHQLDFRTLDEGLAFIRDEMNSNGE